jgi:undecaprenyl-diphosphatase
MSAQIGGLALAVGVLIYAAVRRDVRMLAAAIVAVIASDLITVRVLKPAFDRERPCRDPSVLTVDGCGAGESLPSAHAANSAAIAVACASPALLGVSAVVGVSRVVTGQHWPSDVGLGWLVGGCIGVAARAGVAYVSDSLRRKKR